MTLILLTDRKTDKRQFLLNWINSKIDLFLQDFPEVSSATSASVQRKHRRRHYYAREDSDEEEVDCSRKTEEAFSDE